MTNKYVKDMWLHLKFFKMRIKQYKDNIFYLSVWQKLKQSKKSLLPRAVSCGDGKRESKLNHLSGRQLSIE